MKQTKIPAKVIFGLILIFVAVLAIHGKLLNLFFSQDDFFHLKISQTDGSIASFLKLLTFRSFEDRGGIYFYRPIFREVLFNLYYRLFGFNPLPFRATQFLIHFQNIALVYLVLSKLTKKVNASLVGALFFGITAAQLGIISYLAGGIQVSGMLMFYLFAILAYTRCLETKKTRFMFITIVLFLLALASHELAITLPAVLVGIYLIKQGLSKKSLIKAIQSVWIMFPIGILYLILEITVIGLPTGEAQYALNFSPVKLLNSYFWYFLWSLGIPEMLVDFVGPGIKLNPVLMRYWGDYYKLIFPLLGASLGLLAIGARKLYKSKIFLFFVFMFVVGIAPVIFQPSHRLYYYLAVSLVGVSGVIALTFDSLTRNKVIAGLFVAALFVLNNVSIHLSQTDYWAISRANAAKSLIADVTSRYPTLPKGASVYFKNDPKSPDLGAEWGKSSKQASIILSGPDALQLVYGDPTLKVYYEDIITPDMSTNVFPITAVIYK